MKNFVNNRAVILLVEDNEGDARLTKEALKDGKVFNQIYHVRDGVEAMAYLHQNGEYNARNAPKPDIILLDLNMPRMDGREVLSAIKKDEELARIPVIVLTTSQDEVDIIESYDMHANCYISKPVDFDRFISVVCMINNFWFTVVSLPDN